ncbi:EAL and HDOD domain-containing protein [Castellaniella sp.]|uniref:EAL and HDOD domain-containing protein n=1 Tax=Castellaniella sp. TaxID=1955812 RepID=UPI003568019B
MDYHVDCIHIEGDLSVLKYCIAMQPICDGELNHVADEILYRSSASATSASITPDQAAVATARVSHVAFYEIGLENLSGKRQVFLNTPRHWLLNPELLPPDPQQLVVEVLETVTIDRQVLDALQHIRSLGFKIALDDFVLNEQTQPLLDYADIVKFDLLQPLDTDAVVTCQDRGLTLLAEKVEDYDTFERLRHMGFTLFQGYFYAQAQTRAENAGLRGNNHLALLHLVAELQRQNTHTRKIERIITQDAQLTFLLLRYVNSAVFHYHGQIKNVFQAVQILGLRRVRNMAITLLLANNGPASKLLMSQALTRASMCEQLAASQQGGHSDSAFLTGLLSMMGDLLGQPLEQLLGKLALSREIVQAVLSREGQLGHLLATVLDFENADTQSWSPEQIDLYNQTWLESQTQTTQTLHMVEDYGPVPDGQNPPGGPKH